MIKCVVFLLFTSCFVSAELRETRLQNVRIRRQSDSEKCVLPAYPKNGQYTVEGQSSAQPGDRYDAVQLQISCHPGYQPLGSNITYCVNGYWSHAMPQCVRHCTLDPHPSVRYQCLVNSDDSADGYYRNCTQHEPSGTVVKPECNEPNYYFSGGVLSHMRCIEGSWNYVATCLPECGRITPPGELLILDGRLAKPEALPWHAVIYQKTTTPYRQICGGSLVSTTVVISVAHCFWSDEKKQLPPKDYAVAVGKLYRPWADDKDVDAQKSDVSDIKIPKRFQGAAANLQDDIAILILSTAMVYKTYVRPVCVDFDINFDRNQLQRGNVGKVAGWGLTGQKGPESQILKVVDMSYVKIEECIAQSPPSFREYITSDKFCASFLNGTALCRGDSGGGLAFPESERGIVRYYLRGVMSTAPTNEHACHASTPTAFTQVIKHEHFIKEWARL